MGAPCAHLCPCAALTELYNPRDRAPLARQAALGVSHFLGPPLQEEERGEVGGSEWGREGGGAEQCVAVDAPGVVRGGRAGVPSRGKRSRAGTSMS
jgi:hypothetical protein